MAHAGRRDGLRDGQPLRPDGSNAVPTQLTNNDALVTPTIGIVVEF